MSKIKKELIERLSEKLGQKADVGAVIDELYRCGALTDYMARQAVIFDQYITAMSTTARSQTDIVMDLSVTYSVSESTVLYIARKGC